MARSNITKSKRPPSPSEVQQPPHPSRQFTFAKRTLRKLVEDSQFFVGLNEANNVRTIHEKEVIVGKLLGKGGFCEVRSCNAASAKEQNDAGSLAEADTTAHTTTSSNDSSSEVSSSSSSTHYAIKYLSPTRTANHPSDPKNKVFQRGIADLAMEACFLSLLRHENIITCHYVSEGSLEENFNVKPKKKSETAATSPKRYKEEVITDINGDLVVREVLVTENNENGKDEPPVEVYKHRFGYFLLLDVLHETLSHRIDHVYIPQVLISNNTSYGADLTTSLLQSCEKRESFLKRMTPKRPSLFQKHGSSSSSKDFSTHSSTSLRRSFHNTNSTTDNISNNNTPHHIHVIQQQKQFLAQRLTSLLSIANALQYLHEHQILFRDIKPDNIGFYRDYSTPCTCGKRCSKHPQQEGTDENDNNGGEECNCYTEIPKLFDFGLAKELKSKYRVEDHHRPTHNARDYSENKEYAHHHNRKGGELLKSLSGRNTRIGSDHDDPSSEAVYKLTGCTGSRRYMAPEVCFNDPYNEKADVYSFGMMLYQVASLVTPFDGYSSYDHEKEVLRGGFRPDIDIPSRKDFVACKRMEQQLLDAMSNGVDVGDDMYYDDDSDGGDIPVGLPPPSVRRNEVLAIKSKSLWTKDLKRLIYECWDYDMRYRPSMKDVVVRLQGCIDELMGVPSTTGMNGNVQQQQKKGRDSFEMKNIDVSRGSRSNCDEKMIHRQENGCVVVGGKEQPVLTERGGSVSRVEIRSNVVPDSMEGSMKKKTLFRPTRGQMRGVGAAVAAEIRQ